jgi:peptidyl-dipeptidase A
MSLIFGEQEPEKIERIFDELDDLTRPTFKRLKKNLDTTLAARYGIEESKLMPWHYQDRFFQEAPKVGSKYDIDSMYTGKNLADITSNFYKSIGAPIDDMLAKSDLYEKPGKNQHAYCIHIDRAGDVRALCNIKENAKRMDTMLHEFGHAIYDK